MKVAPFFRCPPQDDDHRPTFGYPATLCGGPLHFIMFLHG
jgi:hypothetical protein